MKSKHTRVGLVVGTGSTINHITNNLKQQTIMKATELNRAAYDHAFSNWINTKIEITGSYYYETLKEFQNHFDIDVRLGDHYGSPFVSHVYAAERWLELYGYRLADGLKEIYDSICDYRHKVYIKGKKFLVSHVNYTEPKTDCPLTGCYADYAILKPLVEFFNRPDKDMDIDTLAEDCVSSLLEQYSKECDAYNDELFLEDCEDLEYDFDEYGNLQ